MFRSKYLDEAEIRAQLDAWATQHPELAHVSVIGKSLEGRDLQLLTIGREPERNVSMTLLHRAS